MNNKRTSVFVAALAALPAFGYAQGVAGSSAVEVYGRLDASVNRHQYSGAPARASRNAHYVSSDTSYWGLRGTEDLGGRMRAYFKMESGVNVDTGAQSNAGVFFNREAFVGVGHASYGSVQLGSQFSPAIWLSAKIDPFRRGNTGAILTLFQQGGAAGPRGFPLTYNNSVEYLTPQLSGFSGRFLVAATEGATPGGVPKSMSLEYAQDRLLVGMSYDRLKITSTAAGLPAGSQVTDSTLAIGGTYRFDAAKLHGYYMKNKIDRSTGMDGYLIGVSVPVGQGEIQTSWQRRNVHDAADSDAQLIALQYMHFLSKRTSVYVGVAHQKNEGNANFGIWPSRVEAATTGQPVVGENVSAFQVGIRHLF